MPSSALFGGAGLPASLVAVFQPSEEAYPSGAEQLAHAELAAITPSAVVAAHIHPEVRWGAVALDPGAVNASCDAVEITVEGRPSHGAYPHHGRDPVLALAHIVVALHALAQDETVRGWLDPVLYDAYVGIKHAELQATAQIELGEACRRYAAIY